MICGSTGSKIRLAKAAGAEPAGQMKEDKLHVVVARHTFSSETCQSSLGIAMLKKCTPLRREAHLEVKTDVQMSSRLAGARECASCQKLAESAGFGAI